jgi:hypothetical protein
VTIILNVLASPEPYLIDRGVLGTATQPGPTGQTAPQDLVEFTIPGVKGAALDRTAIAASDSVTVDDRCLLTSTEEGTTIASRGTLEFGASVMGYGDVRAKAQVNLRSRSRIFGKLASPLPRVFSDAC